MQARVLRVWQNHGLQLDRVPEGFKLLATSYLCRNQMMVKRDDGQLIYTVQFHLEKSFEDWNKSRTRWEHQNESRDGRILFENFLFLALRSIVPTVKPHETSILGVAFTFSRSCDRSGTTVQIRTEAIMSRRDSRPTAKHLARRDNDLACDSQTIWPPPLWARKPGFATLVHIILEQQVSLHRRRPCSAVSIKALFRSGRRGCFCWASRI